MLLHGFTFAHVVLLAGSAAESSHFCCRFVRFKHVVEKRLPQLRCVAIVCAVAARHSVSVRSLVWLAGIVPAIWRRICRLLASEPFKRAEASFVQVKSRLRQVIERQQDNARVPGRNGAARLESAQSCCARLRE